MKSHDQEDKSHWINNDWPAKLRAVWQQAAQNTNKSIAHSCTVITPSFPEIKPTRPSQCPLPLLQSNLATHSRKLPTKQAWLAEPKAADLYLIGQDIQNHSDYGFSSELNESTFFCSIVGCRAEIALHVWNMLSWFNPLPCNEGKNYLPSLGLLFHEGLHPRECSLWSI